MASITKRTKRGIVASLSTIALAAVGLVGMPAAAFADADTGTADLTLHKSGGEFADESTGQEIKGWNTDGAHPPVVGATYSLYKADGIDLTGSAGWTAANPIVRAFNDSDHSVAPVTDKPNQKSAADATFTKVGEQITTGNDGTAKGTFDVGLYLVIEDTAGTIVDNVGTTAGKVEPFMVSLPLQDNAAPGGMNYAPHIYVKATTPGVTVDPVTDEEDPVIEKKGAVQKDGTVRWTIRVGIPKDAATDEKVKEFIVTDVLKGLKYESGEQALSVHDTLGTKVAAAPDFKFEDTNGTLTWTFNSFEAIKQGAGGQVQISLVTTVLNGAKNPTNAATVTYNGEKVNTKTEGGEAVSEGLLSTITVNAVDQATTGPGKTAKALPGAKFTAATGTCAAPGTSIKTAAPITTNNEGTVAFTVPWASASNTYCLTPTAAPAGYAELTDGIDVTIAAAADGVTQEVGFTAVETTVPKLPTTGANGRVLMMGGGAAAILLAGGLYLSSRKREHEDA